LFVKHTVITDQTNSERLVKNVVKQHFQQVSQLGSKRKSL